MLTRKQKRMRDIVARLRNYWITYDQQACFMDYTDSTFMDDALYGIGIAIDPVKFRGASGFDAFKAELRQLVSEGKTEVHK